jgi:EmrB/QacA subfamily drug resistance transporter
MSHRLQSSPRPANPASTSKIATASKAAAAGKTATASTAATASSRTRWLALAVLCTTVLIASLDNTVLNVALPTLVRDLKASSSDLQWITDAYIIVFAGLLLAAGSLADRVGRKKTFLVGLAVFGAGSAAAAAASDVTTLIAARAGMGVGGALMIPSTLSIISNMFRDGTERQRAISLWAGTSGIGVALGPIIGGLLLAHFWWGSVFLINVPIAVVGFIAALWLVPDSKNPHASAPDLPGAAMSVAGLGAILWSIIEAPSRGWSDPAILAVGAAGLALLGAFVAWERHTSHPLLNLRFFAKREFSAAIPAVATAMFGLYGALFVLTQFLQFSLGYTPLQTGVRVLPAASALLVIAPVSALLVRTIGAKLTMTAGLVLIAVGLWQISGATVTTTFAGTVLGMALLGAGAGLAIPTATGSVLGSVPESDSGVASATNTTAMQVGGALGVAVVGSLLATRYQNMMTASLSGQHLPHAALTAIQSSLGGALAVAAHVGGTAGQLLAHLARTSFVSGMDLGLFTAALVALTGALLALAWLPGRPGRGQTTKTH